MLVISVRKIYLNPLYLEQEMLKVLFSFYLIVYACEHRLVPRETSVCVAALSLPS